MQAGEGSQLEKALRLQAGRVGFEAVVPNPKLKLLDQVREVLRLRHYSIRTEQSYCDWIRRYVRFHRMRSRAELIPGEAKVEQFLSDLAVNGHVAAATQNQALNALLFLYREVLHEPFENVQAVRAKRPVRVPTVLTPEEVKRVIEAMSGTPQLVVKLLYGSGLRLMEGLRLRVQDLDFEMKQLIVRDGKGAKDRFTVLAEGVIPALREHLANVRLTHQEDVAAGFGAVYLPGALDRDSGVLEVVLRNGWNNRFQRSGSAGRLSAFPVIWIRTWQIETAGFKRVLPRARPRLSQTDPRQDWTGVAALGAGFRPSAPPSGIGHPQADGKLL
jgi:integrase